LFDPSEHVIEGPDSMVFATPVRPPLRRSIPIAAQKTVLHLRRRAVPSIRERVQTAVDPPVALTEDLPRFLRAPPATTQDLSAAPKDTAAHTLSITQLSATVLLPFAFGYYLSYLFRSINAVIAGSLVDAFKLSPTELGVMTSVYFLACALMQLPAGMAIDHYGPRRVQATLMLVVALGAALFSQADTLAMLVLGRTLIGVGVSVALMAALNAIVASVPSDRVAQITGIIVMLGGLGAVTATLPADVFLEHYGWRRLFNGLALLCLISAVIFYLIVPEQLRAPLPTAHHPRLQDIMRNPGFWRVAPLSTVTIATSWSLQTLWAAPWLQDVEGYSHADMVKGLCVLAVALCVGSLVTGAAAGRLRRSGLSYMHMLAAVAACSIVAQLSLVLRSDVPALLPWVIIAASGGASVLGFMATTDQFPEQISGRINAVLNLLQVGCAFFVQSAVGAALQFWPPTDGHAPVAAYQWAFGVVIGVQGLALGWFWLTRPEPRAPVFAPHPMHRKNSSRAVAGRTTSVYERAAEHWHCHVRMAREQLYFWRAMALGTAGLTLSLYVIVLDINAHRQDAAVQIVQVRAAGGLSLENQVTHASRSQRPYVAEHRP
jgi:predicted MFS family arabinose efflux permease